MERQCLRWVVLGNRLRFRCSGNYYGDQALFVRRHAFETVGGFPQIPLLEDIRFFTTASATGADGHPASPVLTSPRRFLARVWATSPAGSACC